MLTALSRFSEPAIYVASVAIHASGIILLIQYLFTRHVDRRYHSIVDSVTLKTANTRLDKPTGTSRGSISEYSTVSEETTRKRRRAHTAAVGGDDYLGRDSSSSRDSSSATTVDRVANGKKVVVNSFAWIQEQRLISN